MNCADVYLIWRDLHMTIRDLITANVTLSEMWKSFESAFKNTQMGADTSNRDGTSATARGEASMNIQVIRNEEN